MDGNLNEGLNTGNTVKQ